MQQADKDAQKAKQEIYTTGDPCGIFQGLTTGILIFYWLTKILKSLCFDNVIFYSV